MHAPTGTFIDCDHNQLKSSSNTSFTVSIHTYVDDTMQTVVCSLSHILDISSQIVYSNPLADKHTDGYNLLANRQFKLTFLKETQSVCVAIVSGKVHATLLHLLCIIYQYIHSYTTSHCKYIRNLHTFTQFEGWSFKYSSHFNNLQNVSILGSFSAIYGKQPVGKQLKKICCSKCS